MDDALNVFEDMIRRRPLPSVVKFNRLLSLVTKMKHFTSSLDLFKQMCSVGVPVDKDTISIALNCCCHLHRSNDCLALLGSCFRRSIEPDVFIFKLLKETVLHKGYSLDHVVTYTSLVNWLCNLGCRDEVRKMIKEMDVQTHSVLVDAFCKEGKLEEAEDVINIMVEAGKVPDIVTYNSLIDGYCLRGDIIKAITIVDSMVWRYIPPDEVTYNIVKNGYCNNLSVKEAMLVFDEITKKVLKHNFIERTKKVLNLSLITENIMIHGLFEVGRREWSDGKVLGRGEHVDIKVYDFLIFHATRCGKFDIAKLLFDEMASKCLQPEVDTYSVMIHSLCSAGLLNDAKEFFIKMNDMGYERDNSTYRALLQGYIRYQRYDDVKMLIRKMDGRGYEIDAPTQRWP